jgi:glycosyltransferase involved in cell wall biosynthesis
MNTFNCVPPLVSVVIPSYNHARFLQDAIDSVLSQHGVSLELIIIDDGSKDDSWQIIEAACRADSRVKARSQRNQGAHAAINAGINESNGEFVAILNSDDRFLPGRLATLTNLASADLDFISTGLRVIDGDSHPIVEGGWIDEYGWMRATAHAVGLWNALLERNFTVSTSNFFFRRTLFQEIGGIRPLRYNMDWDWAIRAYLRAPERFAWRDDLVLLEYRIHGANTILGGLPVSAIEANHILYLVLQHQYNVPGTALAALRRHHRLIRHQQTQAVATARDAYWESELHKAHDGWVATRDAHDETHVRLGETLTELGAVREALLDAQQALQAAKAVQDHTAIELADTKTELGNVKADLAGTKAALDLTTHVLNQIRTSFGYRVLKKIRKLFLRRNTFDSIVSSAGEATVLGTPSITAPAPRYRVLTLPPHATNSTPRVAIHIHVHYVELIDELLDAASQVPQPVDLFVTTTQPPDALKALVRSRFSRAHIWQCPNQGKDIGPFMDALNRYRLDQYDLVLKLHGKKSNNQPSYIAAIQGLFGKDIRDGDDWRRKLIEPIAGSTERVMRIYQAFAEDSGLGMVGAAKFICKAPDADPVAYSRLCQRLGVSTDILFFGGTMFWIRGAALSHFIKAGITQKDFDPAQQSSVESTLEHGCERVFGAVVAASGGDLAGV